MCNGKDGSLDLRGKVMRIWWTWSWCSKSLLHCWAAKQQCAVRRRRQASQVVHFVISALHSKRGSWCCLKRALKTKSICAVLRHAEQCSATLRGMEVFSVVTKAPGNQWHKPWQSNIQSWLVTTILGHLTSFTRHIICVIYLPWNDYNVILLKP